MILYRYFVPVLAAMALAVGATALVLNEGWGLYALPLFALLMIGIGTDNAWDLLFGDFGKRSFISLPPT